MNRFFWRCAAAYCSTVLLLSNLNSASAESSLTTLPTTALGEISDALPLVSNIDGSIHIRNYFDQEKDGPEEEYYEFRNDLRLGAGLEFTDWLSGRISGLQYLHYGRNEENYHPEQTAFRLFDAYVDIVGDRLDLRIGRQVIRWGKGDEVNPIDNFTPEYFREFINLDRAERKLPTTAVNAKYYVTDSLRAQAIYIPFFQENLFAGTDQDWEFFFRRAYREAFGLRDIPEQVPENTIENGTYAAKLAHQGDYGDVSISYAYHWDQNVNYAVTTDPSMIDPEFGPVVAIWDRQHTVGADFETVAGKFGIRGETAFTLDKPSVTLDRSDDDLIKRKHTFVTLLGVDYTFDNGLYVNLQVLQDFIVDRESQMFYQAYEGSVTARIRKYLLRERLKLEFTGRSFYTHRDFFFHVGGSYELAEGLLTEAEYHLFEGDSDRLFGQFDQNDQFFLGLKYVF